MPRKPIARPAPEQGAFSFVAPFQPKTRWVAAAAGRLRVSAEFYAAELNAGRKICGGCRRSLPRDERHFGTESSTFDRLRSRCRDCVSACKKDHYGRNKDRVRDRYRDYLAANRERIYAYNAAWSRNRNRELRDEATKAYGGKCACCGETEPAFLQLDHIYNDGAADRKQFKTCTQLMISLRSKGWPKDRIQLLCANCNFGKLMNGGTCPHQERNPS